MTDDEEARAIAAGLTKAQWEARAKVNECDGRCPRPAPCQWCAAGAAAAVAAFLRAMGGVKDGVGWVAGPNLAAAVEQAARDGDG